MALGNEVLGEVGSFNRAMLWVDPPHMWTPSWGKDSVKHIDAYRYFDLSSHVRPVLAVTPNTLVSQCFRAMSLAQIALDNFIKISEEDGLTNELLTSTGLAKSLSGLLADIAPSTGFTDRKITQAETDTIQEAVASFENILHKEIADLPLFLVVEKGNFSTEKLIIGASVGYPKKVRDFLAIVPACELEIDEAGRCLAFERATACGFHILRSVEIIIRHYVLKATGSLPPLNRQNWGEYISVLRNAGAAKEITDLLQNIKDNYRNPLMHPVDVLEIDDAISLVAICQSTTEALIRDMEKRKLI